MIFYRMTVLCCVSFYLSPQQISESVLFSTRSMPHHFVLSLVVHAACVLQSILQHLLELQGRAERLCERSKLVFPVHLRKLSQPAGVLRAQALVSYSHRQVGEEKC